MPPWLLKTIRRKTKTADDMFGAEFIDEFEYDRRHGVQAIPEEPVKASAPPVCVLLQYTC